MCHESLYWRESLTWNIWKHTPGSLVHILATIIAVAIETYTSLAHTNLEHTNGSDWNVHQHWTHQPWTHLTYTDLVDLETYTTRSSEAKAIRQLCNFKPFKKYSNFPFLSTWFPRADLFNRPEFQGHTNLLSSTSHRRLLRSSSAPFNLTWSHRRLLRPFLALLLACSQEATELIVSALNFSFAHRRLIWPFSALPLACSHRQLLSSSSAPWILIFTHRRLPRGAPSDHTQAATTLFTHTFHLQAATTRSTQWLWTFGRCCLALLRRISGSSWGSSPLAAGRPCWVSSESDQGILASKFEGALAGSQVSQAKEFCRHI
jgi:hypothetical protein